MCSYISYINSVISPLLLRGIFIIFYYLKFIARSLHLIHAQFLPLEFEHYKFFIVVASCGCWPPFTAHTHTLIVLNHVKKRTIEEGIDKCKGKTKQQLLGGSDWCSGFWLFGGQLSAWPIDYCNWRPSYLFMVAACGTQVVATVSSCTLLMLMLLWLAVLWYTETVN